MKRFTVWRKAYVIETHVVEAPDEETAREMLYDCGEPIQTEWVDWCDDEWQIETVEIIDPLYRMVKGYKSVDKLSN